MVDIAPFTAEQTESAFALILPIQQLEFGIPITRADQPDLEQIPMSYQVNAGNFWVALEDSRVVGTLALMDLGGGRGTLRKMFVHSEFRGVPHRTGQRLLETLLEWSRAHSFREILLGTTEVMKGAHRFYEKNGFVSLEASELPPNFPRSAVDTVFYRLTL